MTDEEILREPPMSVPCEHCDEPMWGDGSHECTDEDLKQMVEVLGTQVDKLTSQVDVLKKNNTNLVKQNRELQDAVKRAAATLVKMQEIQRAKLEGMRSRIIQLPRNGG